MNLPIAFVDCETTHLSAEIGEAWEVAVILREDNDPSTDTEYLWEFSIDPETVDPEALRIGRWHDRHQLPARTDQAAFTGSVPAVPMTRADAVKAIVDVLRGAVLVGSNPAFDDRFLRKLVGPGNAQWHYRPYDIVQLAAAKLGAQALGPLPWPTHPMSRAVGVEPPSAEVAHTALGDARWARDVHDAAMVKEQLPLSWEGRANHAIGLYTKTAIELEDTRRDLAEKRGSHDRACQTVAAMHAAATGRSGLGPIRGVVEDVEDVRAAVERVRALALAAQAPGADGMAADVDTLWPSAVLAALGTPAEPVMTGEAPCTCTLAEPCGCGTSALYDQDDEEFEETGDANGDVFELISEIAVRLTDATDEGEYHAASLIADLANGRKTIAEARAELAEITFRHV